MANSDTISTNDFFQKFPDETAARKHFELKRWGNSPYCGHCGSTSVVECKDHKPVAYRCRDCRNHFSVRTGTVLAESRLPLHKWLLAIYMLTSARKGIPSTQMAREMDVTQKSAWFLAQRIRETWLNNSNDSDTSSPAQVDECFVGGKEQNKHASLKLHRGRGSVGKIAVIGMREQNGNVTAKRIADVAGATLKGFLKENVDVGSVVVTDNFRSYSGLSKDGYIHKTVNHSVGEYVGDQAHTNGIESYWALLKRGHYGIYHFLSAKHLHRYVNAFSFRHNTSSRGTMYFIDETIQKMLNKRLTYTHLTNA